MSFATIASESLSLPSFLPKRLAMNVGGRQENAIASLSAMIEMYAYFMRNVLAHNITNARNI